MNARTLDDGDRQMIADALRRSAELYQRDAALMTAHGLPRLATTFNAQEIHALEMAEWFDNASDAQVVV